MSVTPDPRGAVVPQPRETCDPQADPDHCGFAQYLYAVSSDDGSVHVWDLTRNARVRANLRPAPNPTGRRIDPALTDEQVPLPAAATSVIALNTVEYDAVTDPLDPSRVVVNATAPCERPQARASGPSAPTGPPRRPTSSAGCSSAWCCATAR